MSRYCTWLAIQVALAALAGLASADPSPIATDGSIGSAPATEIVPDGNDYRIGDDLGEFRGNGTNLNLFYSFLRLSVPQNQSATFYSDTQTPDNVIARVTGGVRSVIDGLLRTGPGLEGSNLFLLNPAGVLFGATASLDVKGSFYASSADRLRFESGPDLDTRSSEPIEPSFLSTARPEAFGFLIDAPAAIEVNLTDGLWVPYGETLGLVGGPVLILGRSGAKNIDAPGATIQIASARGGTDIPVQKQAFRDFDPSQLSPEQLDGITMAGTAIVNVSGDDEAPAAERSAGSILIRGGRFMMSGSNSQLLAQNRSDADAAPEGIDVAVRETLALDAGAKIRTTAARDVTGRAGDIRLSADTISLSGANTNVRVALNGPGRSGDIHISARQVSLSESGASPTPMIQSRKTRLASDDAEPTLSGNIYIDAETLTAGESASIVSQTEGPRAGGAIEIEADNVSLASQAVIESIAEAAGAGGRISIDARTADQTGSVDLAGGGQIASGAGGAGEGGTIDIRADHLSVSNAEPGPQQDTSIFALASATSPVAARGGDVNLAVAELELRHGGQIYTLAEAAMNAGDVTVMGADRVHAEGVTPRSSGPDLPSGLFAQTAMDAGQTGHGGALQIDARVVEVENGAALSTSTFGRGNAGALTIGSPERPSERISVRGGDAGASLIATGTEGELAGSGSGGFIEIDADRVELLDGGQITASTSGAGQAGSVTIRAGGLQIAGSSPNNSGVFAQSNTLGLDDGGSGGLVDLAVDELLSISDGGAISASTSGSGDAGTIRIHGGGRVELASGGTIRALGGSLSSGKIGTIRIEDAAEVSLSSGSEISARALGFQEPPAPPAPGEVAGDELPDGSISIDAGERLLLADSRITTESTRGSGGQIEIHAKQIVDLLRSEITTSVELGEGGGGDILIDPEYVVLNRSAIKAQANQGPGGNILIVSDNFLMSADSVVSASSKLGIPGTVTIRSPNRILTGEITSLPSDYQDPATRLHSPCAARRERSGSFVVQRRGGLAAAPDERFSALDSGVLSGPAGAGAGSTHDCETWEVEQ